MRLAGIILVDERLKAPLYLMAENTFSINNQNKEEPEGMETAHLFVLFQNTEQIHQDTAPGNQFIPS